MTLNTITQTQAKRAGLIQLTNWVFEYEGILIGPGKAVPVTSWLIMEKERIERHCRRAEIVKSYKRLSLCVEPVCTCGAAPNPDKIVTEETCWKHGSVPDDNIIGDK